MAPSYGTLVVFGSGPGIGRTTAAYFAKQGFKKIILISRNHERLVADRKFVGEAASSTSPVAISVIAADLASTEALQNALAELDHELQGESLDALVFNVFRPGPSPLLEWSVEALEKDLKISTLSLYTIACWAVPHFQKRPTTSGLPPPALFVTSGFLAKDPFPGVFSLATSKAAQASLVVSLHKQFSSKLADADSAEKGIYFGLVTIGGTVADESEVTNPQNIAQKIWGVYERGGKDESGKLSNELIMEDPAFAAHVKNREAAK